MWGASAAAANFSDRSGLATPEALRFAQWWFPLVREGVVVCNGAAPAWPKQVACGFAGSWTLPHFAGLTSVKWDFWPQPTWPTGTSAYAGNDYGGPSWDGPPLPGGIARLVSPPRPVAGAGRDGDRPRRRGGA